MVEVVIVGKYVGVAVGNGKGGRETTVVEVGLDALLEHDVSFVAGSDKAYAAVYVVMVAVEVEMVGN